MSEAPLSVAIVEAAVAAIAHKVEKHIGDESGWHSDEDDLLETVIKALATGNHFDSPAEIAAAAAKVYDIKYSRWYE